MKINKEYLSYISDKIKNGKIEGLSSYYKLHLSFDDDKKHNLNPNELELIADDIQNGKIDGEIKIYDNNNKLIMCYWNLEVDEIRLQQESYFDKSILTDITAKIKKGIFKSNNFNLTFKNFYNPLDVLDIIDVYDLNDISNSILRGNKIGNIITKNDKGYDQIEWKLNLIEENCKSISDCIILNEFKKYN